jgi:hypothetical protein
MYLLALGSLALSCDLDVAINSKAMRCDSPVVESAGDFNLDISKSITVVMWRVNEVPDRQLRLRAMEEIASCAKLGSFTVIVDSVSAKRTRFVGYVSYSGFGANRGDHLRSLEGRLVEEGLLTVGPKPSSTQLDLGWDRLKQAERVARRNRVGIWQFRSAKRPIK